MKKLIAVLSIFFFTSAIAPTIADAASNCFVATICDNIVVICDLDDIDVWGEIFCDWM
jgi:hypothetical protein